MKRFCVALRAIKAEIIKAKTEPGAGGEIDEAPNKSSSEDDEATP